MGDAQRVAVVALRRIRETRQFRALGFGQFAVVGVGHDRPPAPRRPGARLKYPPVHVAVRRMMCDQPPATSAQLHLEPVVIEPHVVTELVRERQATAIQGGEAERAD